MRLPLCSQDKLAFLPQWAKPLLRLVHSHHYGGAVYALYRDLVQLMRYAPRLPHFLRTGQIQIRGPHRRFYGVITAVNQSVSLSLSSSSCADGGGQPAYILRTACPAAFVCLHTGYTPGEQSCKKRTWGRLNDSSVLSAGHKTWPHSRHMGFLHHSSLISSQHAKITTGL